MLRLFNRGRIMNNNILGCVYIIKCIKNNKIYVGQTIDIKRRIWEHKHALEGSKHKNKYKYGETYNPSNYKH